MTLLKIALLSFALTACISEGTAPDEPTPDDEKAADLRSQCTTIGETIQSSDSTFSVTCGPDDL